MVKRLRRFSAEEYHRLAQAGVLQEDEPVELIRGEILEMSPIGSRHAAVVNRLARFFIRALEDEALVSVQNPLRLGPDSEPQPDLALLRPKEDDYATRLPQEQDVLLLVEVAEASLAYDLEVKLPLYASHGIPEVWVVDLGQGRVRVFRNPKGRAYRESLTAGPADTLSPLLLPNVALPLEKILLP
ncbi:Uma2 family endonuclease [Thermus caliditerrae]|uniref:Uma2 family endonuclease n=1 Tax=Thermus caliditerrae TaxID=1330700 RepID=UPI001F18FDFC|nr:Uma2 family endonuclease [Thermus caliditerrae]